MEGGQRSDPDHRADAAGGGPLGQRGGLVVRRSGTLPDKATWYLVTNQPRAGGPRESDSDHPAVGLAEIVRLYAIRNWIEQGYKQVKDELGCADFQVRSDLAIRRHQVLVNCAFSFCWATWVHDHPAPRRTAAPRPEPGRGERGPVTTASPPSWPRALRAVRAWLSPWIALRRWWPAWSTAPPPRQLKALMTSLQAGRGLHLYIPN